MPPTAEATTGVSHLSVYLTSWGGINIVGGADLGVYWWAPALGGEWRFNELTDAATGGPALIAETVTSYVTPWGGLNVAGLDQAGRLWVYWWSPTVAWVAETIDAALPERDAAVERTGRLRSTVSSDGEISISDPVRLLFANFGSDPAPCWSACDANGDGATTGVSDAVYTLRFLFRSGPAPAGPFPACGPASLPTDAALGCESPPETCW